MSGLFQIAALGCAALMLTCCSSSEKNTPIWQDVKIANLASSDSSQPSTAPWPVLKTINFDVYIFEIPAENISALDDIWQMLYIKPLQFSDYNAFKTNLFSAGFGPLRIWNKIRDSLLDAGAEKVRTVSLMLPDGQANRLFVARLDEQQTIFYSSTAGSIEAVSIGPGTLTLRITAEKIPDSPGVCRTSAQPAFSPLIKTGASQPTHSRKTSDLLFTSAGFTARTSPGDFVLLGPKKYTGNQIILADLFFSRPQPKPVIRIYLLICTAVN